VVHRALVLAVLAAASTAAHADAPAPAPAAGGGDGDNRGLLVSAAVSAGTLGGKGLSLEAHGEVGWGLTPYVAALARASVGVVFDKNSFKELQLGARVWPAPDGAGYLSFELHGGRLAFNEEYDCLPETRPNVPSQCWGGDATGYSGGVTLRAQVRSRNASFDVLLSHDRLRWRDASTNERDSLNITRLGLGFSFY
jgi:hypothetical protein